MFNSINDTFTVSASKALTFQEQRDYLSSSGNNKYDGFYDDTQYGSIFYCSVSQKVLQNLIWLLYSTYRNNQPKHKQIRFFLQYLSFYGVIEVNCFLVMETFD